MEQLAILQHTVVFIDKRRKGGKATANACSQEYAHLHREYVAPAGQAKDDTNDKAANDIDGEGAIREGSGYTPLHILLQQETTYAANDTPDSNVNNGLPHSGLFLFVVLCIPKLYFFIYYYFAMEHTVMFFKKQLQFFVGIYQLNADGHIRIV